jgi:hypothetical protein
MENGQWTRRTFLAGVGAAAIASSFVKPAWADVRDSSLGRWLDGSQTREKQADFEARSHSEMQATARITH